MKYFLLSCLCVFSMCIKAQDVRFGLKAGVNFANASGYESNTASITSFHIGGIMEALYTEKWAIQPEIVYSQQGFDFETEDLKERYRFSYINIPIMVKYFMNKGIFLEAGPQIGYLNTAKLKRKANDDNEKINIKDAMRDNDLSLNLGVGFQTNSGWSLVGRYNWGLTNLVRKELDQNFKNSVFQISLGYFF
ncbi:MAG: porin family protein [Gelidibacter sp.]